MTRFPSALNGLGRSPFEVLVVYFDGRKAWFQFETLTRANEFMKAISPSVRGFALYRKRRLPRSPGQDSAS